MPIQSRFTSTACGTKPSDELKFGNGSCFCVCFWQRTRRRSAVASAQFVLYQELWRVSVRFFPLIVWFVGHFLVFGIWQQMSKNVSVKVLINTNKISFPLNWTLIFAPQLHRTSYRPKKNLITNTTLNWRLSYLKYSHYGNNCCDPTRLNRRLQREFSKTLN